MTLEELVVDLRENECLQAWEIEDAIEQSESCHILQVARTNPRREMLGTEFLILCGDRYLVIETVDDEHWDADWWRCDEVSVREVSRFVINSVIKKVNFN